MLCPSERSCGSFAHKHAATRSEAVECHQVMATQRSGLRDHQPARKGFLSSTNLWFKTEASPKRRTISTYVTGKPASTRVRVQTMECQPWQVPRNGGQWQRTEVVVEQRNLAPKGSIVKRQKRVLCQQPPLHTVLKAQTRKHRAGKRGQARASALAMRGERPKPLSVLRGELPRVDKLPAERLHDQTRANRSGTRQNAGWTAINDRLHTLQIRLECALGHTRCLDADSTEVLRLTAASHSVSRSGTSTSEVAASGHGVGLQSEPHRVVALGDPCKRFRR